MERTAFSYMDTISNGLKNLILLSYYSKITLQKKGGACMSYRFKSIIMILLLSLLFNIFHDLVLSSKVNHDCQTNVQLMIEESSSSCTHIAVELHKHFHFIALFEWIDLTLNHLTTSTKLSYVTHLSPQFILESSFKPPRS